MQIKLVSIQVGLGFALMGGVFSLLVQPVQAQTDTSGTGINVSTTNAAGSKFQQQGVTQGIPEPTANDYVGSVSNMLDQLDTGTFFDPNDIPQGTQQTLAEVLVDPTPNNQQDLITALIESQQISEQIAEELVGLITDAFDDVDDAVNEDENLESCPNIPNGISHVVYELAEGSTVKVDNYLGDVKDPCDPQKYIEALEAEEGQDVVGYTIKAGPNYYNEQGVNVTENIPDGFSQQIPTYNASELEASDLAEVDEDFTDDLSMRVDQAQKLSQAINLFNQIVNSLDEATLRNPPKELLAIRQILVEASEATQIAGED
ncbi:hypothetical protein PCC7418_2819 [Halothece sp. PCC 7418]|uniref:hypothetical protein n=1 Tax=Halothece sp. (strain PCC 7418) TaxID=65093 RepID=UPI0002A0636A|nr:hypothetical protein [Halothece sp. PCC 7418]AFZ44951.1 hypothetical protein PCC7418_2819 [Halothece sp. PCC 7418]